MDYNIGDTVVVNGIEGTVTGKKDNRLFVRLGNSHYSKLYNDDDEVVLVEQAIPKCACSGCY